jgi:hypothetical protein
MGVLNLAQATINSGRNYKPLWKVDPKKISSPTRRVPVLYGCDGGRLDLGCSGGGGASSVSKILYSRHNIVYSKQ